MPTPPAQRQAAYRQKHLDEVDGSKARINQMVDHKATLALSRIAMRYGLTKTELLERLIQDAQDRERSMMSGEEATAYYDSVTA